MVEVPTLPVFPGPSTNCTAFAAHLTYNGHMTASQPNPTADPEPAVRSNLEDQPDLLSQIEAALMATDRPIPSSKLANLLGKISGSTVNQVVRQLNEAYEQTGRSFRIELIAGGWQIITLPQYDRVLATMRKSRQQTRLSPAALETLAIIAYKQPIVRAEIEAIRGVSSGEVLRNLLERHMIKIVGRAEELGRPMLYGTTKAFLEVFGLASLKDLPKEEELSQG